MPDIDHVARTVEAVSAEVVRDAVTQVKAHPQYQAVIDKLSAAALDAVLGAIGIGV